MSKKDPFIDHNNCPSNCNIFFERRTGKNGSFYFCHRCKNTISEDIKGAVSEPCGICDICGGLLFWRISATGNRYKLCWTVNKHGSILKQINRI